MKKRISILVLFASLFFACNTQAQEKTKQAAINSTSIIEVVQFHLEHRCFSCTNIEKFSRATLKGSFPAIPNRPGSWLTNRHTCVVGR